MTDNTLLKKDATELLNKLISFKRSYLTYGIKGTKSATPADEFERKTYSYDM